MADVAIRNTTVTAAPKDYLIPGTQELLPKAVRAVIDGTGAAGAFQPVLQLLDPNGNVMWESTPVGSVAAGGSADVSWFPGVGGFGGGGVQSLVGASIQATSTQTIPDSTSTDLVYQTVAFDTDGMANLASDNRILTVHTAGLYLVVAQAHWPYASPSAGRRHLGVQKNAFAAGAELTADSRMPIWAPVGGDWLGDPHTDNLAVAISSAVAGDFFASSAQQYSGASQTVNGQTNCYLSAMLLGAL